MSSLVTLTDDQLKFYFTTAAGRNELPAMSEIVWEMMKRGMRCGKYCGYFRWNKDTVRSTLEPFIDVSRGVRGNLRTNYTPCGGQIFNKSDEAERYWIDAYTAIKLGMVNATFAVRVRRPGQEATFALSEFGQEFPLEYKELGRALSKWREIADRASTSQ